MKKLHDIRPDSCCDTKLDYKDAKTNTIDYKGERATCNNCNISYEQNMTTKAVYVLNKDDKFIHQDCGKEVDCIWRTHSIHDGLFTLSGSGEVDRYPIPYCAVHEEKPSETGLPITI